MHRGTWAIGPDDYVRMFEQVSREATESRTRGYQTLASTVSTSLRLLRLVARKPYFQCPGRDSNPRGAFAPEDFKVARKLSARLQI
jgi:hypothetical protein